MSDIQAMSDEQLDIALSTFLGGYGTLNAGDVAAMVKGAHGTALADRVVGALAAGVTWPGSAPEADHKRSVFGWGVGQRDLSIFERLVSIEAVRYQGRVLSALEWYRILCTRTLHDGSLATTSAYQLALDRDLPAPFSRRMFSLGLKYDATSPDTATVLTGHSSRRHFLAHVMLQAGLKLPAQRTAALSALTGEHLCIDIKGATAEDLHKGAEAARRFFENIDVAPADAARAVLEIEQWAMAGYPGDAPSEAAIELADDWDEADKEAVLAVCLHWTNRPATANLGLK